jgi:hypothetical protein
MRNFSLVSFCGLLLVVAACSSDSSDPGDPGGGEIRSQDDVRRLFEAVVPDLVETFTELANQQFATASALPSSTNKAEGDSSVPCPGGGTLVVNVNTGLATLTNCVAGGVTISASLTLAVFDLGLSMYDANFNGLLMVSGSFNGTVNVNQAFISWTAPATVDNTFWEVTVTVNDLVYVVSSADSGNGTLDCSPYDPPEGPNSGPPGAPCDEDGDCQANSCRDPMDNPSEGCTCRNLHSGGDCSECIGVNAGPVNDPNPATQCEPSPDVSACTCQTQNGETVTLYLSGVGCI